MLNQDIHINAIGYKEIESYLSGDYTLEEAKNDIIKASKRLAKKQKTWFKNQMQAHALDATSHNLLDDALTLCYAFLNQEEKK